MINRLLFFLYLLLMAPLVQADQHTRFNGGVVAVLNMSKHNIVVTQGGKSCVEGPDCIKMMMVPQRMWYFLVSNKPDEVGEYPGGVRKIPLFFQVYPFNLYPKRHPNWMPGVRNIRLYYPYGTTCTFYHMNKIECVASTFPPFHGELMRNRY